MLKIRLQRVGRKHEPYFRLVLTDSKNATRSGRFKEILGSYDPRKTIDSIKIDRVKHWLSMGASPTATVHNLFVNHKILDAKKINVLPKKTLPPVEEKPAEEAPVAEMSTETPTETTPEEAPAEETAPATEAPAPEEAPAQEETKGDTMEQ